MTTKKAFLYLLGLLFTSSNLIAQELDFSAYDYPALDSIIAVNDQIGNNEVSIACSKFAIEKSLAEFGKTDSTYALYLGNLGSIYTHMGNFQEGESFLLKSKAIMDAHSSKMSYAYSGTLGSLAQYYVDIGKTEEAEPLFLQAKAINKAIFGPKSIEYAGNLNDVAAFYYAIEKYEEAELNYLECQSIVKEVVGELHFYNAILVSNLGSLYYRTGKFDDCEAMYLKSLEIIEKTAGKENANYTTSLNNLASLYYDLNKYEKAERLHKQTIALNKKVLGTQHPRYANDLNNLAFLYGKMNRYGEAERLYLESISIFNTSNSFNSGLSISAFNNLASLYIDMDNFDAAYSYAMTGIANNSSNFSTVFPEFSSTQSNPNATTFAPSLFNKQVNPSNISSFTKLDFRYPGDGIEAIWTLVNIMEEEYKILVKKGALAEAKKVQQIEYDLSKAIISLLEQTRNSFSSKANKLNVLKSSNKVLAKAIKIAKALNHPTSLQEAFNFAEQNKSMLLADALKGNQARTLGDLPDSLIYKEIALQERKESLKKEQYLAKDEESKANLTAAVNKVNEEIEAFLKSIKQKYPKYHALKYQNITANVEEVQALLDEKSLFLEYFISDSSIYLFSISKKDIQLYPLDIKINDLQDHIKNLRQALSDYDYIKENTTEAYQLYTNSAFWFYKNLLAPSLTKQQGINRLIIIPDDALGHIPFEAFLTKASSEEEESYKTLPYLVNDYKVSYNYSATLLKENMNHADRKNNGELLAFAANYNKTEVDSQNKTRTVRAPHLRNLRDALTDLPAARTEVTGLSDLFKGQFLFEDQASEKNFKAQAPKYAIIHLAMHGLLNTQYPVLSSLAFTENGDSSQDNFLQAYEIASLNLNADLVVLSACETGYGKFQQGEGVMSLARSFMYAGVPSLVVSLWQVNDASTSLIMQSFYQNLGKGMDKATALQEAKISYMEEVEDIAAHPAFWAPFIQLGDSRPITVETKGPSSQLWWLVGAAGLLALVTGAVAMRRKKGQ